MSVFNAGVVYVLIWWMVLFCVLPLNIHSIRKPTGGAMPGAPSNPDMKRKIILTTAISCVVWLVVYLIICSNLISYTDIASHMSM